MQSKKPIKHSVAIVVYSEDREKVLIVQRPYDDESLPGVWGLPASSLKREESFEDAVLMTGNEKLGIELKIIKILNEGSIERKNFLLHMKEYEVEIIRGKPKVPQNIEGVTQYQDLKYGEPRNLIPAAQKGPILNPNQKSSTSLRYSFKLFFLK